MTNPEELPEIYESPILSFGKRRAVGFAGVIMTPTRARRITEYAPTIRKFLNEGMSVNATARRLGWSQPAIRCWALMLGYASHRPPREPSPPKPKRPRGRPRTRPPKPIAGPGLRGRPRVDRTIPGWKPAFHASTRQRLQALEAGLREGMTGAELARRLKLKKSAIYTAARADGIPMRKRRWLAKQGITI